MRELRQEEFSIVSFIQQVNRRLVSGIENPFSNLLLCDPGNLAPLYISIGEGQVKIVHASTRNIGGS